MNEWDFDGFIIGDDGAVGQLFVKHFVAVSQADAIDQWLNAGGQISYYDFPIDTFISSIQASVTNGTLPLATLKERVRGVLNAKWDVGLFDDPFIPSGINETVLAESAAHKALALEAAHASLVLLENKNETLPLSASKLKKVALIGPFVDTMNYGDYAGEWGYAPIDKSTTVRAAMEQQAAQKGFELVTYWGANSWLYNGQYPIAADLLSTTGGQKGGLLATYFEDTNFSQPVFQKMDTPNLDWGIYPPNGLSSNNFSVRYEGTFRVASKADKGWIGVAVGPNSTARLFVDDQLIVDVPSTPGGNIIVDVPRLAYNQQNATIPPPGSAEFKFIVNATHKIRIDYQAFMLQPVGTLNMYSRIQLFWNLVDQAGNDAALQDAKDADVVVFVGGGAQNSDSESGDRATLDLAPAQCELPIQVKIVTDTRSFSST